MNKKIIYAIFVTLVLSATTLVSFPTSAVPDQKFLISELEPGWNVVSLPFSNSDPISVSSGLKLEYFNDNTNEIETLTWSEASQENIVEQQIFEWVALSEPHAYAFADSLENGKGYWIYAYEECTLFMNGLPIGGNKEVVLSGQQDDVDDSGWNLIGFSTDQSVDLTTRIAVHCGDESLTWAEATDYNRPGGRIIDPHIFAWDRGEQSYAFVSTLEKDHGAWIFAYQDCTLEILDIF